MKIFPFIATLAIFLLASCRETLPSGVQKLQTAHRPSDTNKIEVLEFFWLGCPQCREFHNNWVDLKKQFKDKAVLHSFPATFEKWKFDARVYLAMQELGVLNDGLLANYYEVRQGPNGEALGSDSQAVAEWLKQRYGTDKKTFLDMLGSPLIESKLKDLQALLEAYPIIAGVPSILISVPSKEASYFIQYQGADATKEIIRNFLTDTLP